MSDSVWRPDLCLDLRCQSKCRWLHWHGLLLWLRAFSGELLFPLLFFLCVRFLHRRVGFSIVIGLAHVDILSCLSVGWCRIFIVHLLMGMSSSSSCSSWTGEPLNGDALLFDARLGVGDFGGASPKILLRNAMSTQVLHIQDRTGRDIGNQIGCGCRGIFLEFREWLSAKKTTRR